MTPEEYNNLNDKTKFAKKEYLVSSYSRLYRIWNKMNDRCYSGKTNEKFEYYGGRGITICDEWLDDKNKFFAWALSNGYTDELTIDRTDNDKGYSPSNCTWQNRSFQSQTTRRLSVRNKTGYRGVSANNNKGGTTCSKPFRARIGVKIDGKTKQIALGKYYTEIEAAKAYDSFVVVNGYNHTLNGVDLFNSIKCR